MSKIKEFWNRNWETIVYLGGILVLAAGTVAVYKMATKPIELDFPKDQTSLGTFTKVENSPYEGKSISEIKTELFPNKDYILADALIMYHTPTATTDIIVRDMEPLLIES